MPEWVRKAFKMGLVFEEDPSSQFYPMGARYRIVSGDSWILLRNGDYLLHYEDSDRVYACAREMLDEIVAIEECPERCNYR